MQKKNTTPRRQWLKAALSTGLMAAACGGLTLGASSAAAQAAYPAKPIRLVVPFAPGGVTDTSGRLIAEQLSKRLGQQTILAFGAGAWRVVPRHDALRGLRGAEAAGGR